MPLSWEIQFRELRKQFDEKSHKHHRTCQQLRSLDGEIISKKKESEEDLFDKDLLIDAWQQDLQALLEENTRLQEENALLEEIIDFKKAQPRPRRKRAGTSKKTDLFSMPFLQLEIFR